MRSLLLAAAMLATGCATPEVEQPGSVGELEFSFSRDVSGARPMLVATITNRSAIKYALEPKCSGIPVRGQWTSGFATPGGGVLAVVRVTELQRTRCRA